MLSQISTLGSTEVGFSCSFGVAFQEAIKCMRHSKRSILTTDDVNSALSLRNVEVRTFDLTCCMEKVDWPEPSPGFM